MNNKKETATKTDFRIINGFMLKIIALIAMLIDHLGVILYSYDSNISIISESTYTIMRIIGRITFPIFCFMIAEGFYYTRNIKKYLIRLSVFALISQIPFSLAFYQTVFVLKKLNIFFTLVFGLLAIKSIDFFLRRIQTPKNNPLVLYAFSLIILILILYLAEALCLSYGAYGILLILVFYLFRIPDKDFTTDSATLKYICTQFVLVFILTYALSGELQFYCLISFVFIIMYNRRKGPGLKYLFYLFYPIHLLLLYVLYMFLY